MNEMRADVTALLAAARQAYGADDAPHAGGTGVGGAGGAHQLERDAQSNSPLRQIAEMEARLNEPLRLAIAGIVKAGKSTLLNSLLGKRVAPTDAGECTRIITWYRHAETPRLTIHPREGLPFSRPFDETRRIDLDGVDQNNIDHLEIHWPAPVLKHMVLVDTPGIASLSGDISARTRGFLAPQHAPAEVDAAVYLMRHVHPSDVNFLEAFRDSAVGPAHTVNAVAVLSRADEIGSGRIDSLISAHRVAHRYEMDGELAHLALGVIPVTGLLSEGARSMSDAEFAAMRALASLAREDRNRLLISADRFIGATEITSFTERERRELIERFGIFGVRLCSSIIRTGIADKAELEAQLVRRSGLDDLTEFIDVHFIERTDELKARGILESLAGLLEAHPPEGDAADLWLQIERIRLGWHGLRELSLLARARTQGLPIDMTDAGAAVRILGGRGASVAARLGLPEGAKRVEIWRRLREELAAWREKGANPALTRDAVNVCGAVSRSLEAIAADVLVDTDVLPV